MRYALLLLMLPILCACDGEFERLQREAEFNARLARAAMPRKGEVKTCKWRYDDKLVCYRPGGKQIVVADRSDVP